MTCRRGRTHASKVINTKVTDLLFRAARIRLAIVVGGLLCTVPASASGLPAEVVARLDAADQATVAEYAASRDRFDTIEDAYWTDIAAKRTLRRGKREAGNTPTLEDYVFFHPPVFHGRELTGSLKRLWDKYGKPPGLPREPIAGLDEMLGHARRIYGFEPTRVGEREFKHRYAMEAVRLGLRGDDVVGVYAFETGGRGTADMQSGVNPSSGKGRPVSSALGYSQLVGANTIDELIENGEEMAARLEAMANSLPEGAPQIALFVKAGIVREMARQAIANAGSGWASHVEYAKTPAGLAMHTLNLDADVGPWLQIRKLAGIREYAALNGRGTLSGAELELLNLAGPASGLDMLSEVGSKVPTANFFERKGYSRNPIVHRQTGERLLETIRKRMAAALQTSGSAEFLAAFAAAEKLALSP